MATSPEDKLFIVAEAGINHNGNIDDALKMIEVAKECGADAIKFQTFKASEFCGDPNQMFEYRSQGKIVKESMFNMFQRFELRKEDWNLIKKRSEEVGIEFFSTPQNLTDLEMLLEIGISRIKIGSDDLTNVNLISNYSKYGLPIILSSGMSDISEIHGALLASGWYDGNEVSVLVCTSLYPTEPSQASISRVSTLQNAFPNLEVGFSDHTIGTTGSIIASALGATIFEKHFTLNKNLPGPDHWFSCNPHELSEWTNSIRESKTMLGSPYIIPSKDEISNKKSFQRSIVADREIGIGEIFSTQNLGAMRTNSENAIPANYVNIFIGKRSTRNYAKGDLIEI